MMDLTWSNKNPSYKAVSIFETVRIGRDLRSTLFYKSAKKFNCVKKQPCAENLFLNFFIFLEDKLNMIDFNIFNILKLIFTCESCASSFTE